MTSDIVIDRLNEVVKYSGSQRKAAADLGISPAHLGELLKGTRTPGPRVLAALGLKKDIVYRDKGAGNDQ